MQETITVYRESERGMLHLPGANPGVPYTACGLDAGAMLKQDRPSDHAGLWCHGCMVAVAGLFIVRQNFNMGGSE